MTPIDLGNSVSTIQWENENELRWYPFESGCSGFDSAIDVVSDISIVSENLGTGVFRLYSVYVGPEMVSVSFSDGTDVLVCTVQKDDFEPYKPYGMNSVSGSASGICSFGNIDFSKTVYAKPGNNGPIVLQTLVVRVDRGNLFGFKDDLTGDVLTGDVRFVFPSGADVTKGFTSHGYWEVQTFFVGLSSWMDENLVSDCDEKDNLKPGDLSPIRSINGVKPDDHGRIALVFE
jgi:hypothetical protein